MSTEVKVPAVGESITTGLLSVWHRKDGDAVAAGDILFTLETDKVSTEVNATESGTLKISVPEGEEVKIGQVVATLEAGGAATTAAPKKAAKEKKEEPKAVEAPAAPAPESKPAPAPEPPKAAPAPKTDDGSRTTRKKLSPLRRKIATQLVAAQHNAAILTTFNECDMSAVIQLRKD
ncbi:MAG: biotin/lipoyl-containing protein, partial [Chthoniobacterales bacterium]